MNIVMNPRQLESLKKRIKSQNYERWLILDRAGWKCLECYREYNGKATLSVLPELNNKVLCKKCAVKYKPAINRRSDNEEIVDEVITHGNMSEIARIRGISRERVRQIVTKSLMKQVEENLRNGEYDNPEGKSLKELVKEEIKQITDKRMQMKVWNKLEHAKQCGVIPEKYTSKTKFAQSVGFSIRVLKRYAPEIIQKIRENLTVGNGGLKWSRYYFRCRGCGTSSSPHQCLGYCYSCYTKTDHFKEIQAASWLRNKDRRVLQQKKYLKKYYDVKKYGGNREKVLKRDGYKCFVCSMTLDESRQKFGEELRVIHLDDENDNRLENLITACRDCFMKYLPYKRKSRQSSAIEINSAF